MHFQSLLFRCAWRLWCLTLAAAFICAAWGGSTPTIAPPERALFEEQHRLAYDIYAARDLDEAYRLLASSFSDQELDRQFSTFAQAQHQIQKARAQVMVWDILYQDYKVVRSEGERCTVYCKWNVVFILGHQKHSHLRSNGYDAIFELRWMDESWKITGSRIVNESQNG